MLPINSAIEVKTDVFTNFIDISKLALGLNVFTSAINYFKGKRNSYSLFINKIFGLLKLTNLV